jgi:hypothetical protein
MTHKVCALVAVKAWPEPMDTAAMTCTAHPQSIDAVQRVGFSEIWHHKATMSVSPTDAIVPMVFESDIGSIYLCSSLL